MSKTGREQAEKLALKLKDVPLSAVYSSPLRRAMDTALAVARYHNLEITPDPGLMEVHVGEFEGMPLDKFAAGFSQFMIDWQTRGEAVSFSGGENLGDFKNRVWKSVLNIFDANKETSVAVVSHYFVTATIVCTALGLPITHLVRIRIQPCSQTILEFNEGKKPRLLLLSDTCHLREG